MTKDTYIVSSEDIAAMPGLNKTHFLNPNAKRVNKSLGDETGLTGLGFHIIEVAPGDATNELHVHYFEEECVYVLSGQATALIGEDSFPIKAGDFIGYRVGGLAHTIINTGTETLRCIVAGQRLDHDVSDYPKKGKRLFRNPGMKWQVADHDALTNVDAGPKK